MLSRLIICGRAVRDAELRRTSGGTPVASLTLAVERDRPGADGQRVTDFIDVVCWRGLAEIAAEHVKKGKLYIAEGRLQFQTWTDRDGHSRKAPELVADSVYFMERRGEGQVAVPDGAREMASGGFSELDMADGELPF